jgi:hypothetical protein
VVSIDCVAVGVAGVGYVVVGRWCCVLVSAWGGCCRVVVGGVRCGCCWYSWCRLACVGFVGWCLVGVGIGLVWVLCERGTLSVQDLVCDGCRLVAVEGGSVGVSASVW